MGSLQHGGKPILLNTFSAENDYETYRFIGGHRFELRPYFIEISVVFIAVLMMAFNGEEKC